MSYTTLAAASLFVIATAGCLGKSEQPQAAARVNPLAESSGTPTIYGVLHAEIPAGAAAVQVYEYH